MRTPTLSTHRGPAVRLAHVLAFALALVSATGALVVAGLNETPTAPAAGAHR